MTERQMQALGMLVGAAVLAAVATRTMKVQAAVLGLSGLELALVGSAASAFVARQL